MRWNMQLRLAVIVGASLAVFLAVGCEENGTTSVENGPEIDALTIICNPLSPAPGEEAQLTTQATGTSGTTWPEYHWVAEAGSLLAEEGISVGWKVPDDPGVYHVEVRASLDQSADSLEKYIMVRNFESLNWDFELSSTDIKRVNESYLPLEVPGGLASISFGDRWYGTHPIWGYHVLINTGTTVNCKTDFRNLYGGDHFSINSNVNQILGSMYMTSSGYFRKQRMDIWMFPTLGFGSSINVTKSDRSDESSEPSMPKNRKNQHVYPYGNENLDMVVWQMDISGMKLDGTDDEYKIGFSNSSRWNTPWNEGQPPTFMTLTQSYYIKIEKVGNLWDTSRVYYKNIRPIITPQDDYIIYYVDSTGTFEPCMIPIVGGEPDTLQRRALMVGFDHGIFWLEGVEVGENTVFQWNPTSDLLGFIDRNNYLCLFDPYSEAVDRLTNIGKVEEFAWAPDGSKAAVIHEFGVSMVSLAGINRIVFEKERTSDGIFGVNWSHDLADPRLAFRIVRKGTGEGMSFSAIVVYSDNDMNWYYASPRVGWAMEPVIQDYRWLRMLFQSDDAGIYAPIPVSGIPDKDVVIYHSYE
jgi:hypothetical protein